MANLQFLNNVVHEGIILKKDMIVSDEHQGLAQVAQDLIARNLVKVVDQAPTHTAALVNGAQEPIAVNAASGSGQAPNVETDAALKAAAKARQEAANAQTQAAVNDQANKEAETVVKSATLSANKPQSGDPTNEEIAAAAAAAA